MARGTEFVHISGAREDGSERILFCDAPRVRWPGRCIDLNWLRCSWDIIVWAQYWHSFFSTIVALIALLLPWNGVQFCVWLMNALRSRLVAVLDQPTQNVQESRAEAAKQAADNIQQELRSMSNPRAADYTKAIQAFSQALQLRLGDDELEDKLEDAKRKQREAFKREQIEKAAAVKKQADDLLRGTARADRVSRSAALAYYDRALLLDPKDDCNASAARDELLADARDDITLWFDIIHPAGLSCMHCMARFVDRWQHTLEAKGSKERGTWKHSVVKWKLFIVALCTIYGALPFYWWDRHVLPKSPNEDEGSTEMVIDEYQKHERIVLLASIGLTLYGLGLVRYWIELQRQGTDLPPSRISLRSQQIIA